jgi:hypothetical protein
MAARMAACASMEKFNSTGRKFGAILPPRRWAEGIFRLRPDMD